jgi:signal transduction histidine kinase
MNKSEVKSRRRYLSQKAFSAGAAAVLALAAGLACFALTEFMHVLLVPDIGRQKERWLAEGIAALAVSALVAWLLNVMRRHQRMTLARMQVIAEINHHIRNALMAISASAEMACDQKTLRVISDGIDQIDWALRNVLPREKPLSAQEQSESMFHRSASHRAITGWMSDEKPRERSANTLR